MDQDTTFPFFRHYDEFGTKAAVAEQDKIGWYNLGLPRSFLSYKHSTYGILATRSWLAATWQFLSESNITVLDPFPKPALAGPTSAI
jgi:hypothetical protein